jgi:hypothetical protein
LAAVELRAFLGGPWFFRHGRFGGRGRVAVPDDFPCLFRDDLEFLHVAEVRAGYTVIGKLEIA